jgi:hypothetical protein
MNHYYFLLVTLWCTIGLAQNNQLITGTVCGGNNETPLPYAYERLEGLPLGTVTEPNGSFRINIPDTNPTRVSNQAMPFVFPECSAGGSIRKQMKPTIYQA